MFERKHEPLLPAAHFRRRQLRFVAFGLLLVTGSLLLGTVGYHLAEQLPWIDALLNASMILFGEGPVSTLQSTAGKLFASFYALFSGVVFVTLIAVVSAPLIHRFLHRFHIENNPRK